MEHIRIGKIEGVICLDKFDGNSLTNGTLNVTPTYIFFTSNTRKHEIWLPICFVYSAEKYPVTKYGIPLLIKGKDFRVLRLLFKRDDECQAVLDTILDLMVTDAIGKLRCFQYKPPEVTGERSIGWTFFSLDKQFSQMGIPNSKWTLSDINFSYQICESYPQLVCVPNSASTITLVGSSKFRSKGRLPVLTYLHPNNQSSLCRSSQPLSGFNNKCPEDILMLDLIRRNNTSSDHPLYIVDARPHINAFTNKVKGKGFEDPTNYPNICFKFFDIDHIHVMRNSYEKLIKCLQNTSLSPEDFAIGIDKTAWLRHIKMVLNAAYYVADCLEKKASVLVHCSDGWDRTAQIVSLAQVIIDPFYRTFEGFQALIEKDWILFGHKFIERCGLLTSGDPKETSPIFVQFLECVHHLMSVFPLKFQFDENLLLFLHDQIYSSNYGTFVSLNEKFRSDYELMEKTYSIWSILRINKSKFMNPFYEFSDGAPDSSFVQIGSSLRRFSSDLLPRYALSKQLFQVWRGLYLRWEWRLPETVPLSHQFVSNLDKACATISEHNRLLRARISQLCRLLDKSEMAETEMLKGHGKQESGTESSFSTPSVVSLGDVQKISPSTEAVLLANDSFESSIKLGDYEGINLLEDLYAKKSIIDPDIVDFERLVQPLDSALTVNTSPETLRSQTREDRAELDLICPFTASVKQLKSELSSVAPHWETGLSVGALCPCCGILMISLPRQAHCITCGKMMCDRCLGELPRKRPIPGVWNHSAGTESAKIKPYSLSCEQALLPGMRIFLLCLTCRNVLINSKAHHFTENPKEKVAKMLEDASLDMETPGH